LNSAAMSKSLFPAITNNAAYRSQLPGHVMAEEGPE
jgi:hypothetical protein